MESWVKVAALTVPAVLFGAQAFAQSAGTAAPSVPAATVELPLPENLTTFDPRAVELRWSEGRWTLATGGVVLKDFGRRETEARQAWHLIRELGLNQRGVIGSPRPVLEYWLAGGRAPQALPRAIRTLPIDLARLRLEQSQGYWLLREPRRVLFNFGTHAQEASQALAVLRKYGINEVGILGQAVPSMLVFVARPGTEVHSLASPAPRPQDSPAARDSQGRATRKGLATPASFYPTPAVPALHSEDQPVRGRGTAFGRPRQPSRQREDSEAAASVPVDRVSFDWRQAHVRRDGADWKLLAGPYTLANFGPSERDARLAHTVLIHYHLNEHHLVGSPEPVARYFLSNGQAPRGLMVGLLAEYFRPEALSVRQLGPRYYIAQGSRPLLDCGPHPDAAQHLLRVIRRHRFDRLCRIGPDDKHSLTFFVRSH